MKLLVILVCLVSSVLCSDVPSVNIPHLGSINGYYKLSAKSRRYAAYEGIPYALPPTGNRRFQPPERKPAWSKAINATALPSNCSQYDGLNPNERQVLGEEDCLYLNIYTPEKPNTPVVFWIHGGGFQYGMGSEVSPHFLIDEDLILVTFNYRVGPFGFLSTNDDVVPGNMGLKDQSLALAWVSENVKYFGGDPQRITLTGVSAGGASVHYHYLSPTSQGLFKNGISFSGTALARWAFAPDTTDATKTLARALDCPINASVDMVECLKLVPAINITVAIRELLSGLYFSYVLFPPVQERATRNYFINDTPTNILESGRAYDAPWIAGVVSEEGLYITAGFALNETMMDYTEKNWETIAPYMMHYQYVVPQSKHVEIAELAKKHYLKDRPLSTKRETIKTLTHLTGDDQITSNTVRAVKLQAKVNKSPVRVYYYSYRAAQSLSDELSNSTEDLGVSHCDDCYLVIGPASINPTTTSGDRSMLKSMLRFWKSFASEGEPDLEVIWPPFNASSQEFQYMHIAGPNDYRMERNDNLGQIQFWDRIGL